MYESKAGFKIASLKVLEGETLDSAPPGLKAKGDAELAAAISGRPRRVGHMVVPAGVAVKGEMFGIQEGFTVEVLGHWEEHDEHGMQVRALSCTELTPDDPEALLVRNLRGVGPKTAAKIVRALGRERVTEVLDGAEAEARLASVDGIGRSKAKVLKEEWDKLRGPRQGSGWLRDRGVAPAAAVKIAQAFGAAAADAAARNPYCFVGQVPGFTFAQAEALAAMLGFDAGAPERAAAALRQVLVEAAQEERDAGLPWSEAEALALRRMGAQYDRAAPPRPWPEGRSLRQGAELLVEERRMVVEEEEEEEEAEPAQQRGRQAAGAAPPRSSRIVQRRAGWSGGARLMLQELHAAEEDVVAFLADAGAACRQQLSSLNVGGQSGGGGRGSGSRQRRGQGVAGGGAGGALLVPVDADVASMVAQCESELSAEMGQPVKLNEGQVQALAMALKLPALVLTGGPGCGKTLACRAVARAWMDAGKSLAMAAPTGRAAQRLQELAGGPGHDASASTIHRLLGYVRYGGEDEDAGGGAAAATGDDELGGRREAMARAAAAAEGFDVGRMCEKGKSQWLEATALLVDETSMMDLPLAAALFNAVNRRRTSVVLVGDPDQLPPVGPGRPLAAALAAGVLPCLDLRQVYRTAASSAIVRAAHDINSGRVPDLTTWELDPDDVAAGLARHLAAAAAGAPEGRLELPSDALLLRLPDNAPPGAVSQALLEVVRQLLPRLGWCDSQLDVQVLSPTKKGEVGTGSLNGLLQQQLNPPRGPPRGGPAPRPGHRPTAWREGDRVVHLVNDTERDVFNGDLGYVESAPPPGGRGALVVRYPPRGSGGGGGGGGGAPFHRVKYDEEGAREELSLAWAMTVHKAQGSEFPVVLLPLHRSVPGVLLRRPLLYTAVSRPKQLLVVVGTREALQRCVSDDGCAKATAAAHEGGAAAAGGGSWLKEVRGSWLVRKLQSAMAARGMEPLPRLVYGPEGLAAAALPEEAGPGEGH